MKAVPPRYRGLWRRTLLQQPGGDDPTTLVLWLQGASWHVDLRIPASRDGAADPRDCAPVALRGLLHQEGFAGITRVRSGRCSWHRLVDYRPTGMADVGRMAFSRRRDAIDERGVDADYIERWARDRRGRGPQGLHLGRGEIWLRSGACFMRATRGHGRGRAATFAALAAAPAAALRRLADLAIDFGRIRGRRGVVEHSTLPRREGRALRLPPALGCVRAMPSRAWTRGSQ